MENKFKIAIESYVEMQENSKNFINKYEPDFAITMHILDSNEIYILNDEVYIKDKLIAKIVWTSEVNKKTLCNHKWKAKIIWEEN